ncbi:MAG: cellulase family glycosylhydrolase, partial [Candidatus Methylomirabilis sp.]|nr:cellulase family glycosylhydrolase [Deltaproteobacteria bacterium]
GSPWWLTYAQPPVGRAFDNFWRNKEGLQDAYAEAWVRLVERFKDDPIVLGYDLMNEPFSGTSNLAEFEDRRLRPFYERVIRRIREIDADSWIWVEPAALAVNFGMGSRLGVVADARAGDPRIVYFPHFYQVDVHEGGPYDGNSFFIDLWEAYRAGEVAKMDAPLVIGEFGAFSGLPGHLRHLREVIAMIDRAGSGFAYWDYSPGGGFSPIDADRSEREQIQALVRVYPKAVAGDPVSYAFDPDAGVFELTFTTEAVKRPQGALPAPTEIYVGASRLYPGGWAVSSSDPEGAWSSSYDPASEVLSVWHDPSRTEHAIRIAPAEAPS